MFQVKTEQYIGPLDKLLELIEAKKMDITNVSLSEVTADFIEYVKTIERSLNHRILADFIAVASRLMLIKSKALLPNLEFTSEEKNQIKDLGSRLLLYREFKAAGVVIKHILGNASAAHSRELFQNIPRFFYPSKNLNTSVLHAAIVKITQSLEMLVPKEERVVARALATIEEKIVELLQRMQKSGSSTFKTLTAGKPRGEIVVLFLALLHLLKNQTLLAAQDDRFSDIIINKG